MDDHITTISENDLTRLLPTCQRCRRLRRKCDTNLPACRLCQKGKVECTFFDHALQQTLPRSYVHSLMTRLGRLRSVQAALSGSQDPAHLYQPADHDQSLPTSTVDLRQSTWSDHQSTPTVSFDKHFIIRNSNPTCWQFLGSSSPYALAVELLVHARAKFGQVTNPSRYSGNEYSLNAYKTEGVEPPRYRTTPPIEEMEMLVNLYLSTTNVLHGYSENVTVLNGIQTYQRYHGTDVKGLTGIEAHQYYRTAMVCAIAACNKVRHRPEFAASATAYYQEALQCIEEVTSDVSPDALEALLLLIMFALLQPRKCDLWKILDYACRLSVELNYHTETNDEFEDERVKQRRRSLFWGLYCLERSIGQHLGRPSDLPEEVITAEYPATLDALPFPDGQSQYALVAHYYRLTYIRSEIFRELYMPATAPDLPRSWYEQRVDQFLAWRREYRGTEQSPEQGLGMGSMTCEMGFETSICFLFQPLLLRALVATKDSPTSASPSLHQNNSNHISPLEDLNALGAVIPHESFDAAVRTVKFYASALNAPESTPAGEYPLSIMSAHYIHQAVFTIMAHCLLVIDGRLPVVLFSNDPSVSSLPPSLLSPPLSPSHPGRPAGQVLGCDLIDYHRTVVFDIHDSCVMLLEYLADKFPGMIGACDIYKNVSDRVLPILMAGSG